MKRTFGSIIALSLLVGCSSVSVNTDYAEGTDFSKFRTFQYKDSDNTVVDSNPLAHQRIVAAVKQGMTSSGLTEVDTDPDVFVAYYGSTDQETHFHTTYSGVNTWSGSSRSRHRVGKYGVNLQDIDTIAVPSMVAENDNVVVVVDEIGKMECFSPMFRQTLLKVLDSPNPVVGSIALKGDAFINAIKKRPDSRLIPVSEKNRDVLAAELAEGW